MYVLQAEIDAEVKANPGLGELQARRRIEARRTIARGGGTMDETAWLALGLAASLAWVGVVIRLVWKIGSNDDDRIRSSTGGNDGDAEP
jgi:hypothetical protein